MVVGLLVCFIIQAGIVIWLANQWRYHQKSDPSNVPAVSIVVCARNESSNITKCIESLRSIEYTGELDIQLINHASKDETLAIMSQHAKIDPRFRVFTFPDPYPSKKRALRWAVQNALNEWILVTDADCVVPNDWVKQMAIYMIADYDIVLGMGNLKSTDPPKVWQKVICWETWLTAFVYGAMALSHNGYMGVGRNMAFRKSSYLEQDWRLQSKLLSGDDDIFIHAFKNKDRIAVQMHPSSVSLSAVKPRLKEWVNQRARHLSTSKIYSLYTKFFLGLWSISHVGLYFFGIVLLFYTQFVLVFSLIVIRWLIMWRLTSQLRINKLMPATPKNWIFADLFMPLYYGISAILLRKKNTHW